MNTLIAALALSVTAAPTPTIKIAKVIDSLHPIAIAPAPYGSKVIVSMEDGSVRIMDTKLRQTVRELHKHPQSAYGVAWSTNGNFVATGDETARIWIENAVTGEKVREYRTHTKGIQKLSFNLPSNLLISTGKDDQVNVYDLRSPKPKEARRILGKGVNFYGGTFSPTAPYLFEVGTLNGNGARAYDAQTGSVAGFLTDKTGQGIFDIAFNPSGARSISAGRDGTAIVWDVKKKTQLGKLQGHTDWVVYAAESPNGNLIATGSADGTVKVWNAYSMQKIAELKGPAGVGSPVAFSADGNTLVSVNEMGSLVFSAITPSQAGTGPTKAPKATKKPRHHRRG